jgi:glycosyltransferase involved in cell wall biosynthesis
MAPLFAKNKIIITIHDLAFKSLKNAFTWKTVLWKKFMTSISIKKACKIIAITNFAKDEILKHYNIVSDKINVVYNGFNDFSKEPIILENISNNIFKFSDKPYILTVSTISPRKNIDSLIKAFDLIKDKIDCNLVIAGKNGWMYEDVFKLVKKLNLNDRIIFTGGINDDELKILYKNANIFAYVSFYEGFGLPPLEAMSYGVQCIVSNKTSLPEVCGQDVTYVDPYDYNDISKKLLLVSKQEGSKQYNQINKFSWMKCAEDVVTFYKTL